MIAALCSWQRHYAAIEATRTPGDQQDLITFPAHKEEALQSQAASIRTSSTYDDDNEQHVRAIDRLAQELGVNAYRFSLEWSRIQPKPGAWDEDAIAHYQEIIDILRSYRIEPMVTLHHFTHPRWFQERCPWHRSSSIEKFLRYTEKIVSTLKDVKYWITFNEPYVILIGGY